MIDPEDPDLMGWMPSSDKTKPPYPIYRNSAGIWFCPCDGFKWRQKCSHIKKFKEGMEVVVKTVISFRNPKIQDRPEDYGKLAGTVVAGLEVPLETFRIGDLTTRIQETEEYLSRLTGLVVRIETAT